jgi:hypothetical protein
MEVIARAALKCPFCGNEDARSYGTSNGKKRYAPVIILNVPIKHFTRENRQTHGIYSVVTVIGGGVSMTSSGSGPVRRMDFFCGWIGFFGFCLYFLDFFLDWGGGKLIMEE